MVGSVDEENLGTISPVVEVFKALLLLSNTFDSYLNTLILVIILYAI